jgi:hypothetical protein
MLSANNIVQTSRDFLQQRDTHLVLYHSGNFEMSIPDSWEDLPPTVTGYCSDDADMEERVGKLAKSLSDRAVAVNLGPYSDTTKILRLRG